MTYSSHRLEVGWGLVFIVIGVGNLFWFPNALVGWVIDVRSGPLALVFRVALHWGFPFSTARCLLTLRVGYSRWNPVAILFVVPVFWLLSLWIWDHSGFILKPVIWFCGLFIHNLVWSVLIPVLGLRGFGVSDTSFVNPVFWFLVVGIVNLLLGIYRRREVFQKATFLVFLSINSDLIRLVRFDDERVKRGGFDDTGHGRALEVLLLILAGFRILMLENEVNLDLPSALCF